MLRLFSSLIDTATPTPPAASSTFAIVSEIGSMMH